MERQTGQLVKTMLREREMDGETPGAIPLTVRDPGAEAAATWPTHRGPKRKIWAQWSQDRRDTLQDLLLAVLLVAAMLVWG